MKLPEHYEKWMDEELEDLVPSSIFRAGCVFGAEAMYHKLMEDMRPAIEVLKDANSLCWSAQSIALRRGDQTFWDHFVTALERSLSAQKQALATLKEKGLVE